MIPIGSTIENNGILFIFLYIVSVILHLSANNKFKLIHIHKLIWSPISLIFIFFIFYELFEKENIIDVLYMLPFQILIIFIIFYPSFVGYAISTELIYRYYAIDNVMKIILTSIFTSTIAFAFSFFAYIAEFYPIPLLAFIVVFTSNSLILHHKLKIKDDSIYR